MERFDSPHPTRKRDREESAEDFRVKRIQEWLVSQDDYLPPESDPLKDNENDLKKEQSLFIQDQIQSADLLYPLAIESENDAGDFEGKTLDNSSYVDRETASSFSFLYNVTWYSCSGSDNGNDPEAEDLRASQSEKALETDGRDY